MFSCVFEETRVDYLSVAFPEELGPTENNKSNWLKASYLWKDDDKKKIGFLSGIFRQVVLIIKHKLVRTNFIVFVVLSQRFRYLLADLLRVVLFIPRFQPLTFRLSSDVSYALENRILLCGSMRFRYNTSLHLCVFGFCFLFNYALNPCLFNELHQIHN